MQGECLRRPKSPELVSRLRSEAEQYRELTNQLGLAFRAVQQEAYDQWCSLMESVEDDIDN